MKKLFTLFCLLTYSFINYGQTTYFSQDFLANTTIGSYASNPASTNQFTEIPTVTGITNTIATGRYQIAKSGTAAVNYRFGRGLDFASEPKSLYCQFNFGVSTAATVTKNNAIVLSLGGSGIVDGVTVPTVANTYAKLNFNLIAGGLTFQLNDGTTNSANFTGNQDITFVMNNTGATFTYVAPNGTNETLGNDLFDVWVGTTKVFDDRPVTTATQSIKRFRFYITHDAAIANAPTVSFDNFLMRDVTGSLLVSPSGTGADNLGNHSAIQNIALNGFAITNNGTGGGININNTGSVGIGTSTPSALLHLGGATNKGLQINSATSNAAFIGGWQDQTVLSVNRNAWDGTFFDATKAGASIQLEGNTIGSNIQFLTTPTVNTLQIERMRILANGNVGVGTTTPTEKLDITGNIKTTGTVRVGAYTLPNTDGLSGQVLQTNGTGVINWQTPAGGFSLPALTSGSLLFSNGTTIAQNNSKMFWDNTNFRLGLGTVTPTQTLDVVGGAKISSLIGTGSRMVITDATGLLSSQAIPTGGVADNLGNHIATQNLNLSTFKLTGNGGTNGITIAASGAITANNLAGTGSRMVITDATGLLSSQAIPTGGVADNLGNHTATQNLNLSTFKLTGNGGTNGITIAANGAITANNLAGTGSRMVVTDANGILSTQAISTGADNLGNHTATQNILLNGFTLTNNGTGGGLAITNTGNIGVGTTTPVSKLDVNGTTQTKYLKISDGSGENSVIEYASNGTSLGYIGLAGVAGNLITGSALGDMIIRTQSKNILFSVDGGSNTTMKIASNGYVGIGTPTPSQALDVTGGAKISSLAGTGSRMVITDANGILSSQTISIGADNLGNHTATQNLNLSTFKLTGNGGTSGLSIANDGTVNANSLAGTGSRMVITDANGNLSSQAIVQSNSSDWVKLASNKVKNLNPVIIGDFASTTNFPGVYNLYVKNGILTEEVKIAGEGLNEWADYVFAKNYKLRTLAEVENFVKVNKHLPGVPSAEEVAKDGINVGKMEAKLLEKIEELTLYMIEMKKENNKLKSRLKRLENK
jgi:trimeric autotransporter adhesin